ncbi:MAG: phosphoglycerate kinase [Chloroflexi bacterium]|nr:phosphoglycerate kinase [Chloroflexota bacterium]
MEKQTIRDTDVAGKRVLLRVDFNVPMDDKTGSISDDIRIREALPTINYLTERGARVIICSHLGRPKGKVVPSMSLAPIAKRLSQLLGKPVQTTGDCVGPEAEKVARELRNGGVLMLENLRFHAEEEANDAAFSKALAQLADIYVNDAFGAAHRAHASTAGVAQYLPAVAGLLMEKEISILGKALSDPLHPYCVMVGGAKISDKIGVLEKALEKVDSLIIGGGMACTFFKAQGLQVGKSLVEDDRLDFARSLMKKAGEGKVRLLLPADAVVADRFDAEANSRVVDVDKMPAEWMMLDIGPKTLVLFSGELRTCKTVIWNGPMGVFEFPRFRKGTEAIAAVLSDLKATTIIGGGSTAEAVQEMGYADKMTHVSTGGGAALEFMEGKVLPGVAALLDR